MAHDAHEDGRRFWIVEVKVRWGLVCGRDCEARNWDEASSKRHYQLQPAGHFTFVPGSTSSISVTRPRTSAVACGQDHALRFDAHQLSRFQVGNDDDSFPDQGLWLVLLADAGDDLTLLRPLSKTDLQL